MRIAVVAAHYNPHGEPTDERLREFLSWHFSEWFDGIDFWIVSDRKKSGIARYANCLVYPQEMKVYNYGAAANFGIRHLIERYDVIIKTDIDCFLGSDLLDAVGGLDDSLALVPWYMDVPESGDMEAAKPCKRAMGTVAMTAGNWRQLRGYDERMFGYGREDGDLCDRALKLGIHIGREKNVCYHYHHGKGGSRAARRWNADNTPVRRNQNYRVGRKVLWHETEESMNWGEGKTAS